MSKQAVGILGVGSYVPENVLTNFDLEQMVDTNDEWIRSRTGIVERRISSDDMFSSDMAYIAAKNALDHAGMKADDIDLIVVATVTPDMAFPSTACLLQEKLGAHSAVAFDIGAACSGFIYALSTASQFIQNGVYRNVLVVGAETLSKLVDYTDRNTCILFGDGAGAVLLGPIQDGFGFLSFELGSDGGGADLLCVPTPSSPEEKKTIYMNGKEVFKFAVRRMEETSIAVIEKANLTKNDVHFLVPHQANQRIIDAARNRLELHEDKVVVNLDRFGNMSSASIPVALDEAVRDKRIKQGDIVVFVAFGGGLTWGGCCIRWNMQDKEMGHE